MPVPQETPPPYPADSRLESEDELANDLADGDAEERHATLESVTSSSSSSAANTLIAADDSLKKAVRDVEGQLVTSPSVLPAQCDEGNSKATPQRLDHSDTDCNEDSLPSNTAPERCEAPGKLQSPPYTAQTIGVSSLQAPELLASSLFRGQDEEDDADEEKEDGGRQPDGDASNGCKSESSICSKPKEQLSLHTYGPSSFTAKRRIYINTVSRKYGQIRGVEDDAGGANCNEDTRARARLATSPPTPTSPIVAANTEDDAPTTPINPSPEQVSFSIPTRPPCRGSIRRSTSPLDEVVARRLPLDESQASEKGGPKHTGTQRFAAPEFVMTGQRRVGLGETPPSACTSPTRKLCIATRGLDINEAIEVSSTSEAGAYSASDSEDCIECDAEGNVLLRTPAVIADEIQRRALAGMARLAEAEWTPTKSKGRGRQPQVKAELRSPSSASKRRKVSPTSSLPSSSKIKKRHDSSSDEGMYGHDDDDEHKSLVAGPSTPSKRRRRPHEGPKRVLPEWQTWEDLLITHAASQGRLGSAAHILIKINEKRDAQGLELREAQDIRNRWAKLKATMQVSLNLLEQRSPTRL